MDKNNQIIMTVERNILFKEKYFLGFLRACAFDFESIILKNYKHTKRGIAERDPTHKQPIAYSIIANPEQQSVFAYQRSTQQQSYDESRLMGKWSWGVGGHIEPSDSTGGNPIHESMERELREETAFDGHLTSKVLGYINDDETEVGKVHFGILYIVLTESTQVKPRSAELAHGKLLAIEDIEKIMSEKNTEVEDWSKIALEPLKEFFENR